MRRFLASVCSFVVLASPAWAVNDTFDSDTVALGVNTLSNGNLTIQGGAGAGLNTAGIGQATEGKKSGKWCVTFTLVTASGNSDAVGITNSLGIGPQNRLGGSGFAPSAAQYSWGYFNGAGNILAANGTASAVNNVSYTAGDTIDEAIDLDNSRLWFRKNSLGTWVGASGTPNPATNTGGFDISPALVGSSRVFPAVGLSGSTAKFTANFGATACSGGGLPTGFTAGWTNTTAGTYFGSLLVQGATNSGSGTTSATVSPWATKHTAGLTGSVTQLVFGVYQGVTGTVDASIYANSAGAPGALLGHSTNTLTNPTRGELVFNFSGVNEVSGTDYWVALSSSADGVGAIGNNLTSGGKTGSTAYATSPYPNPFGTINATFNNNIGVLTFITPAATAICSLASVGAGPC